MLSCCLLFAFSCSEPEDAVEPMMDQAAKANMKGQEMSKKMKVYYADLSPLNDSGVMGHAELTLEGHTLTVEIWADGLTPNMEHPQHIHGFMENNRNATCPPPSADEDGDGLVELGEGLPYYGTVLLPLLPYPIANDEGEIHYMETFDLNTIEAALMPLQNRAIVLHGMYVEGTYWELLPVACGQVMPNSNGMKKGHM